jgi:hypothetical protein
MTKSGCLVNLNSVTYIQTNMPLYGACMYFSENTGNGDYICIEKEEVEYLKQKLLQG